MLNFLEIQRLDYDQIKVPKLIVKCILKVLYYFKIYKIFPKKEIQTKVKNDFDFLVNLNTNKEIYFDLEQQILIKKFANNYRYQKSYYIRNIAETDLISNNIIKWDYQNKTCYTEFLNGQRLQKRNLYKGKKIIKYLWPYLYKMYNNKYCYKKLKFRNEKSFKITKEIFLNLQLEDWIEEVYNTETKMGLIHGDLKQSNILFSKNKAFIIDWEEFYQRAPVLTDVFYYLYRFTFKFPVKKVIDLYLNDNDWLLDVLDDCNKQRLRLNLVYFTYWLNWKYIKDGQNGKTDQLEDFIYCIAKNLKIL